MSVLKSEAFKDREGLNEWRVESFGDDGECHVTIFSGPAAEFRATMYANWMNAPAKIIPDSQELWKRAEETAGSVWARYKEEGWTFTQDSLATELKMFAESIL